MKKNRKKAETYRFNGHPFLHPGSIHSVTIAELQLRIEEMEAKLADARDGDDKKWTAHWLRRYRQELAKKQKGLGLKEQEKAKQLRSRGGNSPLLPPSAGPQPAGPDGNGEQGPRR